MVDVSRAGFRCATACTQFSTSRQSPPPWPSVVSFPFFFLPAFEVVMVKAVMSPTISPWLPITRVRRPSYDVNASMLKLAVTWSSEKNVCDVVIGLVVIHAVYTTAVIGGFKLLQHTRPVCPYPRAGRTHGCAAVCGNRSQGPNTGIRPLPAAIGTAFGTSVGRILLVNHFQVAEGRKCSCRASRSSSA